MSASVFFDNNSTTLIDPEVLDAMQPYLHHQYGNPTSRHRFGRAARQAIDLARQQVAYACGAHPTQIIFTSGGTESNNFALMGMSTQYLSNEADNAQQILVSAIEHPAVTRPAFALRRFGHRVGVIACDHQGRLMADSLSSTLERPTALVSMMLVNNETGVIQDVASLAKIAKQHGALVHTDAVQALGKIPLNFNELGVDAMTLSSHKIYGPQGAGALVLDKRVDIQPLLHGGGQERGLRSGTENVAAIVGFGKACELISARLHSNQMHCRQLRDRLEQGLTAMGATIFGQGAERVNNTSFFAFEGIEGETMVVALDNAGFAVASGSACSSDSTEPSHVLMAMGVPSDLARGAVRISLSAQNTMAQIDEFLMVLQQQQQRLKTLAGVAMM